MKSVIDRPLCLCNTISTFQSQLSLIDLWSMKNRFQNVFGYNCKKVSIKYYFLMTRPYSIVWFCYLLTLDVAEHFLFITTYFHVTSIPVNIRVTKISILLFPKRLHHLILTTKKPSRTGSILILPHIYSWSHNDKWKIRSG